jgi:hypothetical protein
MNRWLRLFVLTVVLVVPSQVLAQRALVGDWNGTFTCKIHGAAVETHHGTAVVQFSPRDSGKVLFVRLSSPHLVVLGSSSLRDINFFEYRWNSRQLGYLGANSVKKIGSLTNQLHLVPNGLHTAGVYAFDINFRAPRQNKGLLKIKAQLAERSNLDKRYFFHIEADLKRQ